MRRAINIALDTLEFQRRVFADQHGYDAVPQSLALTVKSAWQLVLEVEPAEMELTHASSAARQASICSGALP